MATPKPHIWLTSDDGAVEFVSLTKETLKGALTVLYKAFFPHENVCCAVGLSESHNGMKELEELTLNTARDGISIVAVDKVSGAVLGAAFNKLQTKVVTEEEANYFETFAARCKEPTAKGVVQFMADFDNKCDIFSLLNIDSLLEIMFLATLPIHREKQISTKLCEASILLAKKLRRGENVKVPLDGSNLSLEPVPKAVSAIFTSFISQRIGQKLGFTRALVVSYDDITYEGRKYSSKIDSKTPYVTVEYKRIDC